MLSTPRRRGAVASGINFICAVASRVSYVTASAGNGTRLNTLASGASLCSSGEGDDRS